MRLIQRQPSAAAATARLLFFAVFGGSLLLVNYVPACCATLIELPASAPRCLPVGFPIAKWTDLTPHNRHHRCRLIRFHSSSLKSSPATGVVSVTHRTCLYQRYHSLNYRLTVKCRRRPPPNNGAVRTLQLAHLGYLRQRLTTWKQRRSLDASRWSRDADAMIKFDQPSYAVNVSEQQPAGVPLLTVHAEHADGLPLYYSMVAPEDTRSASLLRLDRRTGVLSTNAELDRESIDQHLVKVTASERGRPLRSASVMVTVYVNDVQDHAPQFERTAYFATIGEDAPVGTTVLHVYASDKDYGANGAVIYSLTSQVPSTPNGNHFKIHPTSGVIQVAVPLDREEYGGYELLITATDGSLVDARIAQVPVKIDVRDVNDNYPQFSQSAYKATVPENAEARYELAKIRASDPDADANGRIRYSIVSGASSIFNIDYKTGDVTLTEPLSAKSSGILELVIRAQDSGSPALSNTTVLEVTILDINDHAPKFYSSQLPVSVRESAPTGQQIARVQAFDADTGENSRIRYSLKFPDSTYWPFTIDDTSGWISIIESLDRERKKKFEFEAIATDNGTIPLSSSIMVLVTVVDENDNAPVFDRRIYNASVAENANRGDEVIRVVAHDRDELATVSYSLAVEGNEEQRFAILSQNDHGLITVNGRLDDDSDVAAAKRRSLYILTVKATDDGGHTDTASVNVYVRDVNSAPTFLKHPFTVAVAESQPVNSTVVVIQAHDSDQDRNAEIRYQLEGGGDHFSIDARTGVIRIAKLLDREQETGFNLKITATDGGDPPLSAVSHLEVVVDDVNDDRPTFEQPEYQLEIAEDVAVGNSIFTVTAVDRDAGQNRIIKYRFADESMNDTFKIDPSSGTIRIEQKLDRESVASYSLEVLAVDQGSPSLTGRTVVKIALSDINDNAPRFDKAVYELLVSEKTPVRSAIGRLHASDPDMGKNAAVSYRIFGGADMGDFELSEDDQGGVAQRSLTTDRGVELRTRIPLDYESKSEYRLQVQASSGDLSSVVDVVVRVLDENDHAPEFGDFYLVIANYEEDDYFNPRLDRVPASDRDFNDTLTFSMEENPFLSLDPNSGLLSMTDQLNTNRMIDASLNFCVTDGPNTACAKCNLRYMHVTKRMLDSSITLRIRGTSRDELLQPFKFRRLVDAIAAAGPFRKSDVLVFSVLEWDKDTSGMFLNVTLAVAAHRTQGMEFHSAEKLRELIRLKRQWISSLAGLHLMPFDDSFCGREPCMNHEICHNSVRFGSATKTLITDNFMLRSVDPIASFHCVCPPGFASRNNAQSPCDLEIDLCYSNPCQHNGTCRRKENGYTCECSSERTDDADSGPNCEYPTSSTDFCPPNFCKGSSRCWIDASRRPRCRTCAHPAEFSTDDCRLTAVSFVGDGYVALRPIQERYRLQIELSVASVEPDGLLFYNGRYDAAGDFVRLRLVDGWPKFDFSFGDGDVRVTSVGFDAQDNVPPINDGEWHRLRIDVLGTKVALSLGACDEYVAVNFAERYDLPKCAKVVHWDLPYRCSDRSVPCHRYLDLNSPLYIGGVPQGVGPTPSRPRPNATPNGKHSGDAAMNSFDGCIKDLSLSGRPVDLSSELIDSVNITSGCARKRDVCTHDSPCAHRNQCSNVFGGYWCDCPEYHGGVDCRQDNVGPSLHFESVQSVAKWLTSTDVTLGMTITIAFYFRTTQTNTELLRAEFDGDDDHKLQFKLKDDRLLVRANSDVVHLSLPRMANGQWRHVSLMLFRTSANVTVDYVYGKEFRLNSDIFYSRLAALNSGGYEHSYSGCLKGISVTTGEPMPARYLTLSESDVRDVGRECAVSHSCQTDPCPAHSHCVQQWDTHHCRCLLGHVGPKCLDVCSLNVCENGGSCTPTPMDRGYACECAHGYTGVHCELAPVFEYGQCPSDWWRPRPASCVPCGCNTDVGFHSQCDQTDGQCICEPGTYRLGDECVDCGCFTFGSEDSDCDPMTGQCTCKGDAKGRRCDRCDSDRAQIERLTGECQVAPSGVCPEQLSADVLWPSTAVGVTSVQSCPTASVGRASRRCHPLMDGYWAAANLDNCTSEPFVSLANLLSELDHGLQLDDDTTSDRSMSDVAVIARRLRNATETLAARRLPLHRQDLYTAYRLLLALLRQEIDSRQRHRRLDAHLQDWRFVRDVIGSSSQLLSPTNARLWTELGSESVPAPLRLTTRLVDLGNELLTDKATTFLRPFQVVDENIVFAIDEINRTLFGASVQLPTYHHYVDKSDRTNVVISKIWVTPTESLGKRAFYSITRSNQLMQRNVLSPLVSIYGSSSQIRAKRSLLESHSDGDIVVTVEFVLESPIKTGYPICSCWDRERSEWSRDDCRIDGFNATTATCTCRRFGTFAVLASDNAFLFHRHLEDLVWYARPLAILLSLVVLSAALLLRCVRGGGRRRGGGVRRAIHICLLIAFAVHFGALLTLSFSEHSLVCRLVAAVLHWSSICCFAWLFLYILHVYRVATELRVSSGESGWLFCVVGYVAPFVIALSTGILDALADRPMQICWFSPGDYRIWTLLAPIALFLVLSFYVGVTCFLMSLNKDWEILLAKLRLKRTVAWYLLLVVCAIACLSLCWLSTISYERWSQYLSSAALLATSVLLLCWCGIVDTAQQALSPLAKSPKHTERHYDDVTGDGGGARSESPFLPEEVAPRAEADDLLEEEEERLSFVGGGDSMQRRRLLASAAPRYRTMVAAPPPTLSQQLLGVDAKGADADEDDSGHGQSDTDCRLSSSLGQHPLYHNPHTTISAFRPVQQATGGDVMVSAPPTVTVGYVTPNLKKKKTRQGDANANKQESYYQSFNKPDLIPTWDDQQPTANIAGSSTSTSPTSSSVAGIYGRLATPLITNPYAHSPTTTGRLAMPAQQQQQMPILSPVQKVLFDGGAKEALENCNSGSLQRSSEQRSSPTYHQRFHTFAPPSRALLYSSVNRNNGQQQQQQRTSPLLVSPPTVNSSQQSLTMGAHQQPHGHHHSTVTSYASRYQRRGDNESSL